MKLFIIVILSVKICLTDCNTINEDPETTETTVYNETELLEPPVNDSEVSTQTLYVRGPCPYGFIHNPNQRTCYSLNINNPGLTWFEALTFCMSMHANLVAVESEQEQIFIIGMIRHFGQGHTDLWTGGNTLTKRGDWIWAGGLHRPPKRFTYTRWDPGEPSNSNNNEKCVHFNRAKSHRWNDARCDNKYYFICEKDV
ncbi:unnamed protein product [Owenia fusiformis]|uniref:Uncharacterized protein n=1 Tax=Owenia fusiformis TaxID=6347 RepID=A0A8J1T7A6_OWEFU|nr:unnamed protein product [Owenia fusiformis]